MDRDEQYFHFANLGLVLIGLLSVQRIMGPIGYIVLLPGTIIGFMVSWYLKKSRPEHLDTFIGMLSLASVVVILARLYDVAITFDNILRIFSIALIWLALFQSFGLRRGKSYTIMQLISVCLFIASVSLALEEETIYIVYLVLYLFLLIFTLRLGLVCEKKNKGSLIVGDTEEMMSLWQQIKIGAVIFSIILICTSLAYPFIPKFNSISFTWIPSTLLGLPEQIRLLKLFNLTNKIIGKDKNIREEQIVDDGSKKREISAKIKKIEPETVQRFPAKEFDKKVDALRIESITIKIDIKDLPLDTNAQLIAELKMSDSSVIPAEKLVDWKVSGTGKVGIDKDARLIPKEIGAIQISASYLGNFSNDLNINIVEPLKPVKKMGFLTYLFLIFIFILTMGLTGAAVFLFLKTRHLSELAVNKPRDFIKELYDGLCRAFKIYGVKRFDYIAHREYSGLVKEIVSTNPEPMRIMTEKVLEARFSNHEISRGDSQETLRLFQEIKDILLEIDSGAMFWKKLLVRTLTLDISMVQIGA